MKVLGLIPARGGSKSIPRKNLAPLDGRPLISYTCEAALGSRMLARSIVSTDDEEIAEVAGACGVDVPFLRPGSLAGDETPSVAVAQHALEWLAGRGESFDAVALLQPTSPLRTARHVDEAVDLLESSEADTVVSVVSVPHRFSPYSVMVERDGWLEDFWAEPLPFDRYRRQDHPPLLARNGPAVLVATGPVIAKGTFYGPRVAACRMDPEDSVDIDGPLDLALAEMLIRSRKEPA